MTKEKHAARHCYLHGAFDELLGDWIGHTGSLPSQSTVLQLMQWSHSRTFALVLLLHYSIA